jgi:hypothetical protein
MKTMNYLKALIGVLVLAAAHLQAQTLAYNYSATTPNESAGQIDFGPYDAGNIFTVNSPIYVDELGLFSTSADPFGVGQTADVSIYSVTIISNEIDSATLVVGPATFSEASPGTLVGQTLEQGISNAELTPGLYMVAVDNFGSSSLPYSDNQLPTVNSSSANTGGGLLSFGGSFLNSDNDPLTGNFPSADLPDWGFYSLGSDNAPRLADANFGFVAVPEPGALAMTTIGFALFACLRRYINRSKKA